MGTLWSLLLVGLLAVLPCAGSAQAAAAEAGSLLAPAAGPADPRSAVADAAAPAPGDTATASADPGTPASAHRATASDAGRQHDRPATPRYDDVRYDDARPDHTWCSALDGLPRHGNGCSSHPYCAQESQLPNAPPQPVPAALPRLVTVDALPETAPAGTPVAHHLAPDLHELQIHRS